MIQKPGPENLEYYHKPETLNQQSLGALKLQMYSGILRKHVAVLLGTVFHPKS